MQNILSGNVGNVDGWKVTVMVDDDHHLNLYVEHEDGTDILEVETGQGGGRGEQMAVRFTTEGIEAAYRGSIE